MSTEVQVPFGLDTAGNVQVTTDSDLQTSQHIEALVSTQPGERVMLPTYGINTFGKMFGPNFTVADTMLVNEVTSAIAAWEPKVNVTSVRTNNLAGYPYGMSNVEVDWSSKVTQPFQTAEVITATVMVGGTVVEDSVS